MSDDIFDLLGEQDQGGGKTKVLDVARLSATALGNHAMCGFRYYALNIKRIYQPTSVNLWIGRVWDDTVNLVYEEKMRSERLLPKDVVQDYYVTQFDQTKDAVEEWEDREPSQLREVGVKGVDIFHKSVFPKVFPAMVQKKIVLPFKNSPLTLVGVVDFVEKSGVIGDNKASKSRKKQDYIDQSFQPYIYSLLFDQDHPDNKREVRFDIWINGLKTKSDYQQIKTVVSRSHRDTMLHYISNALDQINTLVKAKNFMPTGFFSRHQWACMYCSAYNLCKKVWNLPLPETKITPIDVPVNVVEEIRAELSDIEKEKE